MTNGARVSPHNSPVTLPSASQAGAGAFRPAIQVKGLTKRFGDAVAVDHVDFEVPPAAVTGFVGVNGSGKTTTMRMMVGLTVPTSGVTRFGDRPYDELSNPRAAVGVVLDRLGGHPGMTGRAHLRLVAASAGSGDDRIDDVLEDVGLTDAANRKLGTYSTGMTQRLALAGALLQRPPVLILDEPARGLDPRGIRWLRDLLRASADAGTAVFVSTHQLAELAPIVDYLVVIDQGRIIYQGPADELLARTSQQALSDAVLEIAEADSSNQGSETNDS